MLLVKESAAFRICDAKAYCSYAGKRLASLYARLRDSRATW